MEAGKQKPRPDSIASDSTGVEARLESTELGKLIDARRKFSIAAAAVEAAAVEAPGEAQREVSTEEGKESVVVVVDKEKAP